MTPLVPLTLFGWIPVVMILFLIMPPRRAMIVSFITAWLFLPIYGYPIQGWLPNYDKLVATCLGIFLATAIFDAGRFFKLRPSWYDLPMLVWCFSPFVSSVTAGNGPYEGVSLTMHQSVAWGLPYLVGRLYLNDLNALRELGIAVVVGGLVYVPLCLYEVRMAPMLHIYVYGFHQHDFAQAKRGGGWRPTVFMQHGLAVGTFMATATLLAVWFWWTKAVKSIVGVPMVLIAGALFVTTFLVKSAGAAMLMVGGVGVLVFSGMIKRGVALWALVSVPILYMVTRTVGGWRGDEIGDMAGILSGRARDSVMCRIGSENVLWDVVQPYLLFGAGRFMWAGLQLDENAPKLIPDGMWIIALGRNGVVGLAAFTLVLLLPAMLFMGRFSGRIWKHPAVAVAAAWSVILALWMVDCLQNAMINPIFLLAAGGLVACQNPWKTMVVVDTRPRDPTFGDATLLKRRPPVGVPLCPTCGSAVFACRCGRRGVAERLVGARVARAPVSDADFNGPAGAGGR